MILKSAEFHLSGEAGPDLNSATVEHVTPHYVRKPSKSKDFFLNDIRPMTTMLGNLTLLDRRSNQELANSDFEFKKSHFASSRFAVTRTVADIDQWDPHVVIDRTEHLARLAFPSMATSGTSRGASGEPFEVDSGEVA